MSLRPKVTLGPTQIKAMMLLVHIRFECEKLMRQLRPIVAQAEQDRAKDLREERKAIQMIDRIDQILAARHRGLRWSDAAKEVGYSNAGTAWTLVNRVLGDAQHR